ncbi:MAG: hypothetical protein JWO87_591 [Phycisphaerales bacterium]|nr:hypothetical protein [Phycisphaerales bacterium]
MPAMPRPWEYTPMRRRVMQAVLCALLALTVVMAWGVGRSRSGTLAVTLGEAKSYPFPVLSLSIRFPKDWTVSARPSLSRSAMVTTEKKRSDETGRGRQIIVAEVALADDQAAPTPEEFAASEPEATEHPTVIGRVDFLGTSGVLVEVPIGTERDDEGRVRKPELYACTVLSASHVAVTVRLTGPMFFGPGDADLVRSVAQSLKPISSATRPAAAALEDPADAVHVKIKSADGSVQTSMQPGGPWVCEISSPSGRGHCTLRQTTGEWPGKIVLRFMRFDRMELLSVSNGSVRIETALDQNQPELTRLGGGQAAEMPYDSAYAMSVKPKRGFLEVTLPSAILAKDAPLEIRWTNDGGK